MEIYTNIDLLSLGSGIATTPEAALEQATNAARDRLKVLASLLA
jgi:hypothetical protein